MNPAIGGSLLVIMPLVFAPLSSGACTLWAAAGARVSGGGTLIAKNRDKNPAEVNTLEMVVPKKGHRYVGLLVRDPQDKKGGTKGGINEKGLVVVGATAGRGPADEREGTGKFNIRKMLSACASVDAVLAHRDEFSKDAPCFYLIADGRKIATVEIGPGGKFSVDVKENGVLCHTNHYVSKELLSANKKIGTSSRIRLERIEQLTASQTALLTMKDFITFSDDRNAGPDNSIWRTGSSPGKERTLVNWIARVPSQGSPELYVKLANSGETEKVYQLTLDPRFWAGAKQGAIDQKQAGIL